jgi:hypothetical protein
VELAMNTVSDIDSFLGLSKEQLQTLDTLNASGDETVHLAKLLERNYSSYEKMKFATVSSFSQPQPIRTRT